MADHPDNPDRQHPPPELENGMLAVILRRADRLSDRGRTARRLSGRRQQGARSGVR